MESMFSQAGIRLSDFIQISAGFILVMLTFFSLRAKRHLFLNWFLLIVFVFQCILIIVFREGLNTKLFAGLMLTSTLIVQAVVRKRRKFEEEAR